MVKFEAVMDWGGNPFTPSTQPSGTAAGIVETALPRLELKATSTGRGTVGRKFGKLGGGAAVLACIGATTAMGTPALMKTGEEAEAKVEEWKEEIVSVTKSNYTKLATE